MNHPAIGVAPSTETPTLAHPDFGQVLELPTPRGDPKKKNSAWVGRHWLEACSRSPVQRPPEGLADERSLEMGSKPAKKKKNMDSVYHRVL